MNTPNFARLNGGFSMLESMIAMGLLSMVAIVIVSSNWQIFHMQRMADRRADNDQMRAAVMSALADSNRCALNLVDQGPPTGPVQINPATGAVISGDIDVFDYSNVTSSSTLVLKSGVASTFTTTVSKGLSNGPTYHLKLEDLTGANFVSFPAGNGRAVATHRYLATLNLSSTIPGFATQSVSRIPISMEFNAANGNLDSCTTQPEDMDEVLVGNVHTVRDCIANQGAPYPTKAGLLCRQPVVKIKTGGPLASCPTTPTPWTYAGYTSTIARDYLYHSCSGSGKAQTPNPPVLPATGAANWSPTLTPAGYGWHYFSNTSNIEYYHATDVKKGTTSSYNWEAMAGATGGTAALGLFIGILAVTNPISALAYGLGIMLGFLFSISGCTTVNFDFYSQVLAIGCF